MRPVRLDMTGFASFREPAVVDFTDADYFALVGPTGSGKSTVIDAMTFALYGSAPRWGKVNAIADALAPTANRCTVRLVFDIGPARYVVAREVRRSGKTVQQKNARLERLLDPTGTGVEGEDTEVLAGELKEVTRGVEDLLGLSFTDFCQCIVLPQGQFAEFLRATPKDRQEILLKLLGAGHYEAIGKAAAARAALAGERTTVLAAQLGDLADATEEAEAAARAREQELDDLATAVDRALPQIAQAAARVQAATADHDRLRTEHDRLSAEQAPDGLADLQAGLDEAQRALAAAVERETRTGLDDTRARAALAAGPSRAGLETAISRHQERSRLSAGRPAGAEADRAAARHESETRDAVATAEQAVITARELRDRARQVRTDAAAAHEALRQRRTDLGGVRTPAGIDALGARTLKARKDVEKATQAREVTETADQQARDALRRAPARGPLEQARADLAEQELTRERIAVLGLNHELLQTGVAAATRSVAMMRERVAALRQLAEDAVDARTAATLRPHLAVGHACPVCDQVVAVLPPPLEAAELDAARRDLAEAEADLAEVQGQLAEVTRREAVRSGEIRSAQDRLATVTAALQGRPQDIEDVASQLARLDALATTMDEAAQELGAARLAERAAVGALEKLGEQSSAARARLLAVHGPLIAAGAPDLDDSDLPSAWNVLSTWAGEQVAALDAGLVPAALATLTAATAADSAAAGELDRRDRELGAARLEHTAAVQAATQAAEQHRSLNARLAELEVQLAGAPTAEEAAGQLDLCARLEDDARRAGAELIAARDARALAEQERGRWDGTAARARTQLGAARDRLVPLGAPELNDPNLGAAWAALLSWAGEQARMRAGQLPELAARIERAEIDHADQVSALRALVAEHAGATDEPALLPARVATVLERARADTRQIVEKRSRASLIGQDLMAAREGQQVAKLLADLLRFDKFPRWLASAALDTLVADASAALSDLSGGQFDLSHDRGEFVVIDHADADSRRSVRTLSGGETFQASLALALALSAQLSTLAAEGAARLDSIFLDEGFGTLDPETLEVVAGTLENLAHGERMVGVITHVAALAERAPVRFAVHRDSRTSTIVRESA